MMALAITVTALVLIALLRFGLIIEYSEAGFQAWAKAGFLKLRISDKDKEKKPKKEKKEKDFKEMLPGSLSEFMDMLRAVSNALGRLKRRLLIKQLTLHYTAAGNNPANTAILFGAANAVFGAIEPVLERNFRIKHRDLGAAADFITEEQGIYAKINISIAVWEVFYVLFALLPVFTAAFKSKPNTKSEKMQQKSSISKNDRKDVQINGKSPD